MKKGLPFLLTLILNVSFGQDTLPFKKRFYLELNGAVGRYGASTTYLGHGIISPYGYYQSVYHGEIKNMYVAGTIGGFYKGRWLKAGLFYQAGYLKRTNFQHSINIGSGFNTLGWLKKSTIWLGPFASIGGILPSGGSYPIGTYRLDVGADLYIRNFHIGYRHSWWDGEHSESALSNIKINYLEVGYAIPLRKQTSHRYSFEQ